MIFKIICEMIEDIFQHFWDIIDYYFSLLEPVKKRIPKVAFTLSLLLLTIPVICVYYGIRDDNFWLTVCQIIAFFPLMITTVYLCPCNETL